MICISLKYIPRVIFLAADSARLSRILYSKCEVSRVRVMLLMSVAYNFFLFTTRPTILLLAIYR